MQKQTFIYQLKPTRPAMVDTPTEAEISVISNHFEYLKNLLDHDQLILAGRTEGAEFGIVIFEAIDENAAKTIMEHDPAILNHVMTGELFPYRLALWRRH
ncbi:MAG: hypothetical protein COY19_08525 [Candidatus Marinimicrobia bacterium CG_4_10_14_0_2_um_filter_48_9]|nr:MAG: hypothetical protein COY19_08525 [Candidatus Marinimicrobia bacterium CG_4_10_14_0_2_um_filter_48_9]